MRTRLLALLTALALVAAACGSDSDDAAGDDATTSTTEASGTEGGTGTSSEGASAGTFGDVVQGLDEESSRFEGTMRVDGTAGSQLSEPVEILVAGSLDPEQHATQISMDMSGLAQATLGSDGGAELPDALSGVFDEPLEIISIGDTSWMRFPFLSLMTGVDTEWIEVPPDETGELTAGLGLGSNVTSPTGLLEQLRDADAEVEELGTEEVRGEEATHYRLTVDVGQLAEQLAPKDQAQLEDELGGLDQALPVDVWIGEDGRLRRYRVELDGAADDQPDVESATIEFEFFDHGTDVTIEPPPADEVTPIGDLAGLVGGDGASGDGNDGSSGEGSDG